jgi:hypothetical protein
VLVPPIASPHPEPWYYLQQHTAPLAIVACRLCVQLILVTQQHLKHPDRIASGVVLMLWTPHLILLSKPLTTRTPPQDTQYCCGAYTPPGLLSLAGAGMLARTTVWLCASITLSSHFQYPQSAPAVLFQQIQNHLKQNTPAGRQAGRQAGPSHKGEHGENALCLCHKYIRYSNSS